MAVDCPIADHPLIGVDLIHELGPVVYFPWVDRKKAPQFELDNGKLQVNAIHCRQETFLVQLKRSVHILRLFAGAPAQHRLDAGHDLPGAERFADVIIGPELRSPRGRSISSMRAVTMMIGTMENERISLQISIPFRPAASGQAGSGQGVVL